MTPFFAAAETAGEFITDPYPKFEEKAEKWGDTFHAFFDDSNFVTKALARSSESTFIAADRVVCD